MTAEFDPVKAAREQLAGLHEVQQAITRQVRTAQEAMSKAEGELNALNKIAGYLRIAIDQQHEVLRRLEEEKKP